MFSISFLLFGFQLAFLFLRFSPASDVSTTNTASEDGGPDPASLMDVVLVVAAALLSTAQVRYQELFYYFAVPERPREIWRFR